MSAEAPPENAAPSATEFHRAIADELFQQVLALLSREDRTCAENARMIHAAHASRFHWEFAGTPVNLGLGEWQCCRVHTAMRHPDSALHHGWGYLEIAENYGLGPFYLAHAHTALAGAFGLNNAAEAERHLALARELMEHIEGEDEKTLIVNELAMIERELKQRADGALPPLPCC
jgi:hypothetical protein